LLSFEVKLLLNVTAIIDHVSDIGNSV